MFHAPGRVLHTQMRYNVIQSGNAQSGKRDRERLKQRSAPESEVSEKGTVQTESAVDEHAVRWGVPSAECGLVDCASDRPSGGCCVCASVLVH